MQVAIGIDGGGTKTSTCCVDVATKKVLSVIKTGSSNWNSVGFDKSKEALHQGIFESLKQAKSDVSQLVTISLCMAGVDRPNDKVRVTEWIAEMLPHLKKESIHVNSDAVAALASGTNGILYGVVVISGTGTISYGFDKLGKSKRASGWGPLLGDEGSGYAIASEVLKAVCSAVDGRGKETLLTEKVMEELKLKEATELIPWAYNEKDQTWQRIAALAPVCYYCASQGDQVALDILNHSASKLSATISAVVRGLDFDPNSSFPIVLAGGNLTHEESLLAKLLSEKLKKSFPSAEIKFPSIDAEVAAAFYAIHLLSSSK